MCDLREQLVSPLTPVELSGPWSGRNICQKSCIFVVREGHIDNYGVPHKCPDK